jgi:hypothetical protein
MATCALMIIAVPPAASGRSTATHHCRLVSAKDSVDLKLTQAQLAARLGTVRELVARALSQLEESGVIARRRGHIVIRDPIRLAALARGEQEAIRRPVADVT